MSWLRFQLTSGNLDEAIVSAIHQRRDRENSQIVGSWDEFMTDKQPEITTKKNAIAPTLRPILRRVKK